MSLDCCRCFSSTLLYTSHCPLPFVQKFFTMWLCYTVSHSNVSILSSLLFLLNCSGLLPSDIRGRALNHWKMCNSSSFKPVVHFYHWAQKLRVQPRVELGDLGGHSKYSIRTLKAKGVNGSVWTAVGDLVLRDRWRMLFQRVGWWPTADRKGLEIRSLNLGCQ